MLRDGEWKLNYYHGQPPQLFNLNDDPNELQDRTDDPACRDILAHLTQKVLDGWDPDSVGRADGSEASRHTTSRQMGTEHTTKRSVPLELVTRNGLS